MLYARKTKEDIRRELESYISDSLSKIQLWENVEIQQKKNSEEYAELTARNVKNAVIDRIPTDPNASHIGYNAYPKICVSGYGTSDRWTQDDISIYHNCYAHKDKIGKYFTPVEIREAIQERISMYKDYVAQHERELEMLDRVYDYYTQAMQEVENKVIEITGNNKNSLYYAVTTMYR